MPCHYKCQKDAQGPLHSVSESEERDLKYRAQQALPTVVFHHHTTYLHLLPRRQVHKQWLLVPHNVRSLIQPVLRSAIRELYVKVPEKVRDDQAHFVVGQAGSPQVSYSRMCSGL